MKCETCGAEATYWGTGPGPHGMVAACEARTPGSRSSAEVAPTLAGADKRKALADARAVLALLRSMGG